MKIHNLLDYLIADGEAQSRELSRVQHLQNLRNELPPCLANELDCRERSLVDNINRTKQLCNQTQPTTLIVFSDGGLA